MSFDQQNTSESNIGNAFLLLLVGMSTVFLMLFLLVSFGKILIRWVNTIDLDIHELDHMTLMGKKWIYYNY